MLMLFDILRDSRSAAVVFECRRCGATLGAESDTCPYCGPSDVVRYVIR